MMGISLHDAPSKAFDPIIWCFFELRFESAEQALEAASQEPSTISPLILKATSDLPNSERWRDGSSPIEMRSMLVDDFRHQLRTGEAVASGIPRDSLGDKRRRIEAGEIKALWFNFQNDEAQGPIN